GGDPDSPVEYAFFLDTNSDPGVYAGYGSTSGSSYKIPATLIAGTTYYWKVKVRDNQGITTDSPVWSFTTEYTYADLALRSLALTGNVEPGAQVTLSVIV